MDRKLDLTNDIILTTYAIMRIDIEDLKKEQWSMLVVDEAQNIKNPDTAQTLAVKTLKSDIRIAMTGTPVEKPFDRALEHLRLHKPRLSGRFKRIPAQLRHSNRKIQGNARAFKLKMSVSPFVLRRLKTDKNVISDLPEKMVLNDYCYLSKPQAVLYEKTLNEMMEKISEFQGSADAETSLSSSPRSNRFATTLISSLSRRNDKRTFWQIGKMRFDCPKYFRHDEKTLIFTQYKEMGDILCEVLEEECNVRPSFFHGSLNIAQREKLIEDFQNNPETKL